MNRRAAGIPGLPHLSDSDAIQARGHALAAACALAGGSCTHLVLDLADQLLHYVTGSMTPEERASFARTPEVATSDPLVAVGASLDALRHEVSRPPASAA